MSSPAETRHDVRVIEVPEVEPVASAWVDGAFDPYLTRLSGLVCG